MYTYLYIYIHDEANFIGHDLYFSLFGLEPILLNEFVKEIALMAKIPNNHLGRKKAHLK